MLEAKFGNEPLLNHAVKTYQTDVSVECNDQENLDCKIWSFEISQPNITQIQRNPMVIFW